jgi:maltose/moltooligosaccharide transporter
LGSRALPWLLTRFGVSNEAPAGVIPDSVRLSFYAGAVVFFAAILWTVVHSKEYSPAEMASFEENQTREGFVQARRTPTEYAANGHRQVRLGASCSPPGCCRASGSPARRSTRS